MNEHIPNDHSSRVADLEAFAGVGASQGAVTVAAQSTAIAPERAFGAQPVAVHRDEARVLQKLQALGAAAGDDWFYRFPVKNRQKGTTDYIEGPSIKLANDLARIYGNCEVDVRVNDLGASWLIYARFNDFETGFSLTRPFQQQKGGSRMGGADDARRLDIAFQIGVSKAIRNVVVNALQTYADYAFAAARNSLVDKIGKNLGGYRDRTVAGIENLGVELIRVELVVGKPSKDWTAPDVARVIAMMKGIADGMSTVDETFPQKEVKHDAQTGEVLSNFAGAATTEAAAVASDTESNEDAPVADGQQDKKSQPATAPTSGAGSMEGAEKADGDTQSSNSSAPSTAKSEGPANDAEYKAHAAKWIGEQTDGEEVLARWAREKKMRNAANVTPETRDELEKSVKAKAKDLKSK